MQEITTPVGFNLGGWLSQNTATTEHIENFIRSSDLKNISRWGFNSVRIPVNLEWLLESSNSPRISKKEIKKLKSLLKMVSDAGLMAILDLHQTPWHSFEHPDQVKLWSEAKTIDLLCQCWAEIAFYLKDFYGSIWFDILNEPTTLKIPEWKCVFLPCIEAIRQEDQKRTIVVESVCWASIYYLEEIAVNLNQENLILSFHFYLPMLFTHQRATWWKDKGSYDEKVFYPGSIPNLKSHLTNDISVITRQLIERENRKWKKETLLEIFTPVMRLVKKRVPLYCGEFGAIETAPRASRLNWVRDVVEILSSLGIGWSYWNYKWFDYGLLPRTPDWRTGPLDNEMLRTLQEGITKAN